MAVVILLAMVVVWWVSWMGSSMLEVRGLSRRINHRLERSHGGDLDRHGFFAYLGRSLGIGALTLTITWGGLLAPFLLIALLNHLLT